MLFTHVLIFGEFLYFYITLFRLHFGRDVIKPHLKGWVIAASVSDREDYLSQLYVYGRNISYVTPRQKALLGDSKFDFFEPSRVHVAMGYENNLGHLIYGSDAWPPLAKASGLTMSPPNDPLSLYVASSES